MKKLIRKGRIKDIDVIARYNIAMALETENKVLDNETITNGVSSIIRDKSKGQYWVMEIDSFLVGQLMVTYEWSDWRNGMMWWIQSVYVLPEYRRQGGFRKLYEEARRRAKEDESVCGCRLYVETENQSAQQVYLKHGFVETGYLLFEDVF